MKRMSGAVVAMCLVLLAASAMPAAWAQTYRCGGRDSERAATMHQQQDRRDDNGRRANYDRLYSDNGRYNDRSVWDRSRDKLTVAGGAGALLGGLAGG